jgi:hypothetical protein
MESRLRDPVVGIEEEIELDVLEDRAGTAVAVVKKV